MGLRAVDAHQAAEVAELVRRGNGVGRGVVCVVRLLGDDGVGAQKGRAERVVGLALVAGVGFDGGGEGEGGRAEGLEADGRDDASACGGGRGSGGLRRRVWAGGWRVEGLFHFCGRGGCRCLAVGYFEQFTMMVARCIGSKKKKERKKPGMLKNKCFLQKRKKVEEETISTRPRRATAHERRKKNHLVPVAHGLLHESSS